MNDIARSMIDEVFNGRPGGNLPKWVKDQAQERGYGDSNQPVSLIVTEDDIDAAFACAAQGNGAACVMAQAGKRLGARAVYFFRGTAWVDFGMGPIVKFRTSGSIYKNIIEPFDKGSRDDITPGVYHLMPPEECNRIARKRQYEADRRARVSKKPPSKKDKSKSMVHKHTERMVMARMSEVEES